MLERWLARAHARLRRLPVPPGDGRCRGQRTQAFRRGRTEAAASADSRACWLAAYEDVRRRHLAGEALLAIKRATGLAPATERNHAYTESFPERAVRRPGRCTLDPFIAYLETRMAEGCGDAMALWRNVQSQGYAQGPTMVQRWVAENRTKSASRTTRKWLRETPASAAPDTTALVRGCGVGQPTGPAGPWPTWMPGSLRRARAASVPLKRSPPGRSRTGRRCAPP